MFTFPSPFPKIELKKMPMNTQSSAVHIHLAEHPPQDVLTKPNEGLACSISVSASPIDSQMVPAISDVPAEPPETLTSLEAMPTVALVAHEPKSAAILAPDSPTEPTGTHVCIVVGG